MAASGLGSLITANLIRSPSYLCGLASRSPTHRSKHPRASSQSQRGSEVRMITAPPMASKVPSTRPPDPKEKRRLLNRATPLRSIIVNRDKGGAGAGRRRSCPWLDRLTRSYFPSAASP
jgi:hypothetical protein